MAKTELMERSKSNSTSDYVFDVSVDGDKGPARRRIQISGQATLYKFAQTIVGAFDFDFDHCFGFYDTLDFRRKAKKAYEYFVDIRRRGKCFGSKKRKKIENM